MDIPDLDDFLTTIEHQFASLDTSSSIASSANGSADGRAAGSDDEERAPAVRNLADIPAQPLPWLWPGWIPAANLTILGGHVGDGKSTVIAALVAALTTGGAFPDGAPAPVTNVLLLSAEDDPARVVRPRLDANGADPGRIFIMGEADLSRDAASLRTVIETHGIGLLVIDPLGSFLRRADRAAEGDIRTALQPLMDVIATTGVAVLGVMRVGKAPTSRRPAQRLVGSSAVPAIARSVIMLARDTESGANSGANSDDGTGSSDGTEPGTGHATLEVVKGNYARPPQPIALAMAGNGTVRWLGPAAERIDEAAASAADMAADRRLSRSERGDAMDFLRDYLAPGPERVTNLLYDAKQLDLSEITIRRAKKELGIVSFRDSANHHAWTWALPEDTAIPAKRRRARQQEREATTKNTR